MGSTFKISLLKTSLFLVLSAGAYLLIFLNIEQLNQFYVSKGVIPAISLLGTIICIAFLYGTAVSNVLSILGLESKH